MTCLKCGAEVLSYQEHLYSCVREEKNDNKKKKNNDMIESER